MPGPTLNKSANYRVDETEKAKLRFDYAWKWFSFHADQRTKMFNFMLIVFGVFATATVSMLDKGMPVIAIGLSIIASILALVFSFLDKRNEELIRFGEDVLVELERKAIFGEHRSIDDRKQKEIPFGILWRQSRKEDNDEAGQSFTRRALRGKHSVLLPLIARLMALLFVATALLTFIYSSEVESRRPQATPTAACEPNCKPVMKDTYEKAPDPKSDELSILKFAFGMFSSAGMMLICFGAVVFLFSNSKLTRVVGTMSILGGVALQFAAIRELKIDKLLSWESRWEIKDPRLEIEIRRILGQAGTIGPSHLGAVTNFRAGEYAIESKSFEESKFSTATADLEAICSRWQEVVGSNRAMALIVGATDRLPLGGSTKARFESNTGLARARAESVRNYLYTHCWQAVGGPKVDPANILMLVSGPNQTPEVDKRSVATLPAGFPEDRRVDVWVLTTLQPGRLLNTSSEK